MDIKIIVHVNKLKTKLDYAQKNEWIRWNGKRNEVMMVQEWIKAKRAKKKMKKNENKK